MAIRTAPWQDKEIRGKRTITLPITDGVTLFIGSQAVVDLTTGRANLPTDVVTRRHLGMVVEFDSPLQTGGSATGNAAGTVRVIIDMDGGIIREVDVAVAAAETDVGDQVFLATDNVETDLTTAATTNLNAIGEIIRFHTSSSWDVLLYSAETIRGL